MDVDRVVSIPSQPRPIDAPVAAGATTFRAFLIADIRGYTDFTRRNGDAAAGAIASNFAALARLAVAARNGVVLELRGDEVLAVFSDPAQAARAAVELQALCVEDAHLSPGFGFPVGAGVDCGDVAPVEGGFRGAAINLAARLCSKANAGEVLATQKLLDAAGDLGVACVEAREPVEVKGYVDRVALSALTLKTPPLLTPPPPGPLPLELDSYVPHVGRDAELSWLLGTWRQARRGSGRVVVVSGAAGIGKSRLVAELAAHAQAPRVLSAGGGGGGAAAAAAAVDAAVRADLPTLVVLDDLHLYPNVVAQLSDQVSIIDSRPVLAVAVVDAGSDPLVAALVARVDGRGDGHRVLAPMTLDEVRGIVGLYAGDELDDAPVEHIARASGGVPARAHELASAWARDEMKRRMSAAAEWVAGSRDRQSSGLQLANNLIAQRLARMFAVHRDLVVDVCPYKGLAPFEAGDAPYFFGRERLVGDLAARSVSAGLLAVVGPSGSGKSSTVLAGLLPSLAGGLLPGSERWRQVTMRPGAHPLQELSAALPAQAGERVIVVVDQFEETFTTCTSEAERTEFIARVVELAADADQWLVVLTIRADFTGHCTPYDALSRLLADNLVLVGPMSADEMKRAIELPARRVGLRVESALVEALVAEVSDEPGGLPLLSTALVELWHARDDGWLTFTSYDASGGVRGAVSRLAEASYAALSDAEQPVARSLLLRLVGQGDGDAAVRRRAPLAEFDDAVLEVLDRLVADRLLTSDDGMVEVAHEALIREWPRLRGWLEEDATGRQLRRHVTQAAKTWNERGRDSADLYRGARLTATMDWAAAHASELNQLERDFLEASRQATVRDADRQRRTNRRLRLGLAGTAIFLVIALIAGLLAVSRSNTATHAQHAAQAEALTSDAERLGSQALVEKNLDKALLLAVAAVKLQNRTETRSDLFSVLERDPAAIHLVRPSDGADDALSVSPDGRVLATASSNGQVQFFDTRTWRAIGPPVDVPGNVTHQAMEYTPDGRSLLVGSFALTTSYVTVVDATTHTVAHRLVWHGESAWVPHQVVSPDGRRLAVMLDQQPIVPRLYDRVRFQIYSLPELHLLRTLHYRPGEGGIETEAAFVGADRLVTSSQFQLDVPPPYNQGGKAQTVLWDLRNGRRMAAYAAGGELAVSSDRRTVALGTNDRVGFSAGRVLLLDLTNGRIRRLTGVTGMKFVHALAFSPDGRTLVTGGDDDVVQVWDVQSGALEQTLTGHNGLIDDIRFGPDNATVYSGEYDGAVVAWDVAGDRRLGRTITWTSPANGCNDSPCLVANRQGTLAALPEAELTGDVETIDPRTLQSRGAYQVGDGVILGIAISPDGRTLATSGSRPGITFSDPNTRRVTGRLATKLLQWSLLFSADGKTLYSLAQTPDNATTPVMFWDVATRKLLRTITLAGGAGDVWLSPDGTTLAVETTAKNSAGLDLLDTRTGKPRPKPTFDQTAGGVAYSPDGRVLAVGLYDGRVLFWNTLTHRQIGAPLAVAGGDVGGLTFSPDGRLLAVDAGDGTATVWDVATRTRIGDPLPGPAGQMHFPAWLPDGNLFEVYQGNGVEWTMATRSWMAHACSVAGRDMTPAEWHDLLPHRPYQHVCLAT